MKYLFIFFILIVHIFILEAKELNSENQCIHEIGKININKDAVEHFCLLAGDSSFKKEDFIAASWYYVLSGKPHKSIDNVLSKLTKVDMFSNIAYAYVLQGKYDAAENFYRQDINGEEVVSLNKVILDDYNILYKLYPHKKKELDKGLQLWCTLYTPLHSIEELTNKYKDPKIKYSLIPLKYLPKLIDLIKKKLGENHPSLINYYAELASGILASNNVYLRKSLTYYNKALKIANDFYGENSLAAAYVHKRLGRFYATFLKDLKKANQHYAKVESINKILLKKNKQDTEYLYIDMAKNTQDLFKKLEYYKKVIQIKRDVNKSVLYTAHSESARIYTIQEDYLSALEEHKKALKYSPKKYSTALRNHDIATIYMTLGDFSNALIYLNEYLVNIKPLDENQQFTSSAYTLMGNCYANMSNYTNAFKYYKKSISIQEKNGISQSFLAENYYKMGSLYNKMRKYDKAYFYAKKNFIVSLKERERNFSLIHDAKDKKRFLIDFDYNINALMISAWQYIEDLKIENDTKQINTIKQEIVNSWLNYKTSVYDKENTISALSQMSNDINTHKVIKKYTQVKRDLAKLYQSLPKQKDKDEWNLKILEKRSDQYALENSLYKKAKKYNLKDIKSYQIAKYLKENELYIDYAKNARHGSYYIFTIDKKNNINFIKIKSDDGKKIDILVKEFREHTELLLNRKTDFNKEDLKKLTSSSKEILDHLYRLLIIHPLKNKIINKTSLIFSLSGSIRLLPFEALYNLKNHKYFIEEIDMHYIPSGKEFIRLNKYNVAYKNFNKDIVLFANPNFNTKQQALNDRNQSLNRMGIIKSLYRMNFAPLPGTKKEAELIKDVFKNEILAYLGDEANEKNLLSVQQPKILHIATHGFFLNDKTLTNDMLKSGIALAGANTSIIKGRNEGIITALKLSGLNLKGTDLVVLSACQTGVVNIDDTNSIGGLSRAFLQAGVKDVIMSLWSVSDNETMELMSDLYKDIALNDNYSFALKQSKLKMIKKDMHPFFWAPFIVNGL